MPGLQYTSEMVKFLQLLRPAEWVKNVFVFAALAFGNRIFDLQSVKAACVAFAAFCLTASAGYVLNDLLDRERDCRHPVKRKRPIASGAIGTSQALGVFAALLAGAAAITLFFGMPANFGYTLGGYLGLTTCYSLIFKHRMILDVVVIAILFVLRALGGAYAIEVPVSEWLLICTFMLCMFLGFGKRRCEVAMLNDNEAMREHRPTLVRYTPELLTHLLSTSGGIAIITFLLYILDRTAPSPFADRKHYLVYTLPLVVYGVFRYAMLITAGKATGPTDLIVNDPPIWVTVILWVLSATAILYL